MPVAAARLAVCVAACVALLACKQPPTAQPAGPSTAAVDETGTGAPPRKKKDPDQERRIRALTAEIAALQHVKDGGGDLTTPYRIVNAHEHLKALGDLDKYLPSARKAGIVKTIVVASPEFTIQGKGPQGGPSMSENFEGALLAAAKKYPDEIVPFFTLDPKDPDKLVRAQKHVEMGGKGLKLYTGHTNFKQEALDHPDMMPVYAWLEQIGLPVNWHINLERNFDEFERVMTQYPRLNVMIPHYGVLFWKSSPEQIARLKKMLREHPRMFIDTSLGTREILISGLDSMDATRDLWRQLIEEFPDRFLYGTDAVITGNREKTPRWYFQVMQATRGQLEAESFHTDLAAAYSKYAKPEMDPDGTFEGLALSPATLKKIYEDNPARWLSGGAATP